MATNSDKARNKLLESMRISKGGVSKTPAISKSAGTAPGPEKKKAAAPKKTTKKPAARNKSATKKSTKSASKSTTAKSRTRSQLRPAGFSLNDPFQGGERIWPD